MPRTITNTDTEDCAPEVLRISDGRGHQYQLRLFDDGIGWIMKVFDRGALAGHVNCLKQGGDLFLADIYVEAKAMHPISGLGLFKCWLGFNAQGQVENYRRRGLGSALLDFVVQRAHDYGFQRVTGKLLPGDLAGNPALPRWYERRGFHVTMEGNRSAGALEFVLACPPHSGTCSPGMI
jgi:GNAT superfamily N-acetyltransferase